MVAVGFDYKGSQKERTAIDRLRMAVLAAAEEEAVAVAAEVGKSGIEAEVGIFGNEAHEVTAD